MIVGKTCVRKPAAWREKPTCPHFAERVFVAAWIDNFRSGERLIENIPLCAGCYRAYMAEVTRKFDEQYARAEREAEKVLKLNQVIQRCGPMFRPAA